MKKIITIMLILIALPLSTFAADETKDYPVIKKQVETRQEKLDIKYETQIIKMNAVIDYIENDLNSQNTNELKELSSKLSEINDKRKNLETHIAINNAIKEAREISKEFKKTSYNLIIENEGSISDAKIAVETALVENEEIILEMKNEAWEIGKKNTINNFDMQVDRTQTILDKLNENEYDTQNAQKLLNDIIYLKPSLISAFESENIEEVKKVRKEISYISKELRNEIKEAYSELPLSTKYNLWEFVAQKVIERTQIIIDELNYLEYDTSNLNDTQNLLENKLIKLNSAIEKNNYNEAKNSIIIMSELFKELKEEYIEIASLNNINKHTEIYLKITSIYLNDALIKIENSL